MNVEGQTMSNEVQAGGRGSRFPWRIAAWGLAAMLLLLPLAAMQFNAEVSWDGKDFIFAGLLIGTVGIAFEVTVRLARSWGYRAGVAAALAAAFMIVWANGAVGMIGDEDNPYNLLFLGVILLAVAGAVVARFRATGMAIAMAVAAVAHLGVGLGGVSTDLRGAVLSAGFAGLWLISAAFFWRAARDREIPGAK